MLGTVGHYRLVQDYREALWLSWFCVAPEARGKGIGKRLLDHAINEARRKGAWYLRLYTGSDPDEARAQLLYESRGLREVRRVRRIGYQKIYRELDLAKASGPEPLHTSQ